MADEKPKLHVFISYATKDATFVNILRRDLATQGIVYWIDKEGLRPGTINWEKGIRQALRDAFAVIYVVTPASYASDNVQGEIAIAEVEDCIIYPIWADGDKWHDCVPIDKVKTQYIDMRGDKYELNRQVLFNALGGKRPDLVMPAPTAVALPEGVEPRNPYKGLNAFTERDVADFFGRDKLITELLQAVNARIQDRKDLFLTVIGASGSGKSSVVMAGLLPRLKAGKDIPGSDQWTYLKPMVPGDHPVQALAKVLYSAPGRTLSNKVIDEDLSYPNGIGLLTTAETLPKHPVVLYIDQFEELFMTGVPEDERQQFINLLINAVTQTYSPVLVLLTMRADFYDRPMNYPELGRLVQSYNRSVLPMSIADLRDTVEKPAVAAGLSFEAGLISDIIFDLRDDKNAQAGALPLLQYTLEQLYERRSGNTLTVAAYQEIGGVKGAIGAHAEKIFLTLDLEAQNAFARVFQALVHIDERGTPTRKREAELVLTSQPTSSRLIEALIRRARVLRVYTEKLGETSYVEVAHEALLISWKRLSNWIKSVDNDLRLIQEMKAAAARWASEGKPKHRLWSHELLQPVYQALERLTQNLTTDEQTFIQPEAVRLLEDFKSAPEHVQLTMIERDFIRIGEAAVPVLVQAYGYASQNAAIKIYQILWQYPYITSVAVQTNITNENMTIRTGAVKLVKELGLNKLHGKFDDVFLEINSEDPNIQTQTSSAIIDMNTRTSYVRKSAAQALATSHSRGMLSKALKNAYMRRAAAALDRVTDKSSVEELLKALKDENANVRQGAAVELGESGQGNNIGGLLGLLKDENANVRAAAALSIDSVVDKSSVKELLEALKDENANVREVAGEALWKVGDSSSVGALLEALKDENASVREVAGAALDKVVDASHVRTLLEGLNYKNSYVLRAVVNSLGKVGDSSNLNALLNVLKGGDSSVAELAAKAAIQLADGNSIGVLLHALSDEYSYIRETAAIALGKVGDSSSVDALLDALKDEYTNVRTAAAVALGKVGDKNIITFLVKALEDRSSYVRQAVVEALGKIGDEQVVDILMERMQDISSHVRRAVVEALAKVGDERVLNVFIGALTDENSHVRAAAAIALGKMRDGQIVDVLMERINDYNSRVRRAVVESLGKIGDGRIVNALLETLKDENADVRAAAAIALGQVGDAQVVNALLKTLKDENTDVRAAAAVALGQVGDAQVVNALLEILKDENANVRRSAANSLLQLDSPNIISTLLAAIKNQDISTRRMAAEAFGDMKASLSISPLVELLDYPFIGIANSARQALELMDIPESRAALAEYDAKHKG